MRKLLTTIPLLCFSIGVAAQENQVWACQEEESGMSLWNQINDSWILTKVREENLLITLPDEPPVYGAISESGSNGTFKLGDEDAYPIRCRTNIDRTLSCLAVNGSQLFYLDTSNGRLGYSSLQGAIMLSDRRSVVHRIYNCTKF